MKLHVQRTSLALTGSLVLLIGFAGLVTPSAYAATQNVACNGDTTDDVTPSDSKKIEDALDGLLASSDPSNVLNISGNCSLTRTITLQ